MCSAEVARRVRETKLATASELFEIGVLDDSSTDESFVRRLNTALARGRTDIERNIPATLADAINKQGVLRKHAELVVFGDWLISGSLGAKLRPGIQADPKKILKCVATIMGEIELATVKRKHAVAERGRESRKREITKHALADQWALIFDEKIKPSNFDAPLRSAKHILADYLHYLKSSSAVISGKRIRKSPEIERALDAITGLLPAPQADRPDIFTEPDAPRPAALVPFEIALKYQSDAHAEEHRRLPSSTKMEPRLRYVTTTTTATSLSGRVRADRDGTITLMPDVQIRRDYKVVALIDRVVILVETRAATHYLKLRNIISPDKDTRIFVRDLLDPKAPSDRWGAPLMRLDETKLTGSPFAIMIQEPTPEVLAEILKAIKDGPGIIEPVQLHLIEASLDFYPKKPCTPEEAVLRRERMVGLLQRHHWTRPSRILEPDSSNPRYADARQIHHNEDRLPKRVAKIRYSFAHVSSPGKKAKHKSDSVITDESIRNRVLTKNEGYPLWLNSTISKGEKSAAHHVSVQNKITDKRDPDKNTYVSLPDEERRARMEVTISGTETLNNYGIHTIDDLSGVSFRKLTRDFLRCKLPMIEPWQHIFEDTQLQMRNRGIYGVNLRLRALAEERRLAVKQAGGGTPRKTKDEELGLTDWKEMNDVIGVALDGLQQRWSNFTTR